MSTKTAIHLSAFDTGPTGPKTFPEGNQGLRETCKDLETRKNNLIYTYFRTFVYDLMLRSLKNACPSV